MTMIHIPLSWKQADADVHVATRDGEFAGFVELDGAEHRVRDNLGTDLGVYPTLDDARDALEHADKPRKRPLRLAIRRRIRRARA